MCPLGILPPLEVLEVVRLLSATGMDLDLGLDLLQPQKRLATSVNPLPTSDAPMRLDLCQLSISLWEFIWVI